MKVEACLNGQQFAASILVGGRALPCYKPKRSLKNNTANAFIASSAGKTFSVQLDCSVYFEPKPNESTTKNERFVVLLCIDGIKVDKCLRCVEGSDPKFVFEDVQTEKGVRCFLFSKITEKMIDKGRVPENPPKKFGTIELIIYKAKDARRKPKGRAAYNEYEPGGDDDLGKVIPQRKLSPMECAVSEYHRVVYVEKRGSAVRIRRNDDDSVLSLSDDSDSHSEAASVCSVEEWSYNCGERLETLTFCYRPAASLCKNHGIDITQIVNDPPGSSTQTVPSARSLRSIKDRSSNSPEVPPATATPSVNSSLSQPPAFRSTNRQSNVAAARTPQTQLVGSSRAAAPGSHAASTSRAPSSTPHSSQRTSQAPPPPRLPPATQPIASSSGISRLPPRKDASTSQFQRPTIASSTGSSSSSGAAPRPPPILKRTATQAPSNDSDTPQSSRLSAETSSARLAQVKAHVDKSQTGASPSAQPIGSSTKNGSNPNGSSSSSRENVSTAQPQAEGTSRNERPWPVSGAPTILGIQSPPRGFNPSGTVSSSTALRDTSTDSSDDDSDWSWTFPDFPGPKQGTQSPASEEEHHADKPPPVTGHVDQPQTQSKQAAASAQTLPTRVQGIPTEGKAVAGPSSAASTSQASRPDPPFFIQAFRRQEEARLAHASGAQPAERAPTTPQAQAPPPSRSPTGQDDRAPPPLSQTQPTAGSSSTTEPLRQQAAERHDQAEGPKAPGSSSAPTSVLVSAAVPPPPKSPLVLPAQVEREIAQPLTRQSLPAQTVESRPPTEPLRQQEAAVSPTEAIQKEAAVQPMQAIPKDIAQATVPRVPVAQVLVTQAPAAQGPPPPPTPAPMSTTAPPPPVGVARVQQPQAHASVKGESSGSQNRNDDVRPQSSKARDKKPENENEDDLKLLKFDLKHMIRVNDRKRKRKERRRNRTSHSSDEEKDDEDDELIVAIMEKTVPRVKRLKLQNEGASGGDKWIQWDVARIDELYAEQRERKKRRRTGTSYSSDEENDDDADEDIDERMSRTLDSVKKKRVH